MYLTQSVVLWDSQTSTSRNKMIYNTEKKHTKSVLYELLYVSFSLFDSNECTKYFLSRKVFLEKLAFMNERLWIYICCEQTHDSNNNCCVQTDWLKNKIIKKLLFEQEGLVHICQNPTQCPVHKYINSYTISFFSYVELRIFTTFNNIFKWIY